MFLKITRTAICDIIVVLLFFAIIVCSIQICCKEQLTGIQRNIALFQTLAYKQEQAPKIKLDPVRKLLTAKPLYKSQYARLIIDRIDVDLPIYFGNTYDVLKNGVGQSPNGYFPGEGGSIICMAHNFSTFLRRLGEVENDDIIKINTSYGNFEYKVVDSKIIEETDLDATPVQTDQEILYLFTCYPFNNIGRATQRYLVIAEHVSGGIE